jgi:DNA-directed RNA polymerase specialized sigma24 family protein
MEDRLTTARAIADTYGQLCWIARIVLRSEQPSTNLDPCALVHELYLRLASRTLTWNDHDHFLRASTVVMKRILISRARRRSRLKHGGGVYISAEIDMDALPTRAPSGAGISVAKDRLTGTGQRSAAVFHLWAVEGWSQNSIGNTLNLSTRTIASDIDRVRSVLRQRAS